MTENNIPNFENANPAEVKYPIILHQNNSINAKPPYKVLRFENGVFMQLIDMGSRKFNDAAVSGGSYSIALFKIKEEEAAMAQTRPERLDYLARMLYEHIPEDRFVRASVIVSGRPIDIRVKFGCPSIDGNAQAGQDTLDQVVVFTEATAAPVQPAMPTMQRPAAEPVRTEPAAPVFREAAPALRPAVYEPVRDIGRIDLRVRPDILRDDQRETCVFAPIRHGRSIMPADVAGLSLTELVSAAFVTVNCNVGRMPQFSKDAKDSNFKTLMNVIAERLKDNPFYVICDSADKLPVRLFNNGVPFTPVFSDRMLAEMCIYGNDRVECVEIAAGKAEFFHELMNRGIVQFIVDSNPLTLAVQGYYNYMANN
ncbi:MAG: hypothetical protein IJA26_00620 [Clostridia bacterium]|nr:hypothetical protein [Clostridia bacterium]